MGQRKGRLSRWGLPVRVRERESRLMFFPLINGDTMVASGKAGRRREDGDRSLELAKWNEGGATNTVVMVRA